MNWTSVKDEGIVLHVAPFREADRLYSILTRHHGKLRCLGRGAQKPKAKLAPALEPFARVRVELVRGRRFITVTSVETLERYWNLQQDIERRTLVSSVQGHLHRFVHEDHPDDELYDLLTEWLSFLEGAKQIGGARGIFLQGALFLRLLDHFGYHVELSSCLSCKSEVLPLSCRWHAGKGGLVCTDCARRDSHDWFAAQRIRDEALMLLKFARHASLSDLMRPALKGRDIEDFAKLVHDLVAHHLPGYYDTPFYESLLFLLSLESNAKTA
jgi:DNA repair protein RecO (recombination protein O)